MSGELVTKKVLKPIMWSTEIEMKSLTNLLDWKVFGVNGVDNGDTFQSNIRFLSNARPISVEHISGSKKLSLSLMLRA